MFSLQNGSKANGSSAPFRIPSLEEVSPEYAGLLAKRKQLEADLADAQRALHDLTQVFVQDESERVKELLGEAYSPAASESNHRFSKAPATTVTAPDPAARAALESRIALIQKAMALLDDAITRERFRASELINRQTEPQYRALVHDLCLAIVEANEAHRALRELTQAMTAEGIAWSALTPMTPAFLRSPTDNNSPLAHYLRRALAFGFVKAEELPSEVTSQPSPFMAPEGRSYPNPPDQRQQRYSGPGITAPDASAPVTVVS